jgi:hypothetical protein
MEGLLGLNTFAPTTSPTLHRLTTRIGSDSYRAEIYYNGQWGTICDDGFDDSDATVFCRSMVSDCQYGSMISNSYVTNGNHLPILADNFACSGSETNIRDCPALWGSHNCGHHEDVGVACYYSSGNRCY